MSLLVVVDPEPALHGRLQDLLRDRAVVVHVRSAADAAALALEPDLVILRASVGESVEHAARTLAAVGGVVLASHDPGDEERHGLPVMRPDGDDASLVAAVERRLARSGARVKPVVPGPDRGPVAPPSDRPGRAGPELGYRMLLRGLARRPTDPEEVVERGARLLADLLGAGRMCLLTPDDDGRLSVRAARGLPPALTDALNVPVSAPLAVRCVRAGRPLTRAEAVDDREGDGAEELLRITGGSVAAAVVDQGRLLGLLVLGATSQDAPGRDDVEFLRDGVEAVAAAALTARHEDERRRRQEILESILRDMGSGVISTDATGRVTSINRQAITLLGLPGGEWSGRPIGDLPEPVAAVLQEAIEDGRVRHRDELHLRDPDRHLGVSTRLLTTPGGRSDGAVMIFTDLRPIEAMERERRRSEHLDFIHRVATGISHELRNRMVSIRTFTQLLPEKWDQEDFRRRFHDIVGREVSRLDFLVENLLFFARPLPDERRRMDVTRLLDRAMSELKDLDWDHVTLYRRDGESDASVEVDPDSMVRALAAVLRNAHAAVEADRGAVEVDVRRVAGEDGNRVVVTVTDNGPGPGNETLERAFDPFYTTRSRGMGLGLTMARKIVEEHDGTITLTRAADPAEVAETADAAGAHGAGVLNAGPGCRVMLDLPAANRAENPPPASPPPGRAPLPWPSGREGV